MKAKKILSAVLSAAMCCSFLTANVSADEFDLPISTESYVSLMDETVNVNNSIIGALPDGYQLEDIEIIPNQPNGISTYSNGNSGVSTYSNSEFVLGLQLSAANPESLINGSPTTDTIICWFWSYGDEVYTYDPDGNAIVEHYVLGIADEDWVGVLSVGDEVIGFATQFTEAGPHDFQYYAENSNGDICGKICSIVVEPSDGNTRPVGSLQVTAGPYYENTNIIFDWSNSYDADNGDYISDARIRVYNNEGYELVTENSEYYVTKSTNRMTLKFAESGTYMVVLSVSDNHNNWSNWVGGQINVQDKITYDLENVVLTSKEVNNTDRSRFTWYDFNEALDLQYQTSNAQGLYDMLTSNDVPEKVRRTTIIGGEWTVSGYVKSSTGEPVANATVKITIPMGKGDFNASVKTNSSGYFSYTCSNLTQWFKARNEVYEARVPVNIDMFGYAAQWCRYGDLKTTSWFLVTDMYITCEAAGVQTSIPVSALSGCSFAKWLGTRWIDGIPGDSSYGWYDLG